VSCDADRRRDPTPIHPVLLFEHEDGSRRVLRVIYDRFAKYGLTVHPEKTRLVQFTRPPRSADSPKSHSGTFDLLGFTDY
jgi:hypothetical protein